MPVPLIAVLVTGLGLAANPDPLLSVDPFADCAELLASDPTTRDATNCVYQQVRRGVTFDVGIDRVDAILAEHPDALWPRLTQLNMRTDQSLIGAGEAEAALDAVARDFDAVPDTRGSVYARLNRSSQLAILGRDDEALVAVADATAVAEAADSTELMTSCMVQHVRMLWRAGRDHGTAYALLKELEPHVFPDGPLQTRILLLHVLRELTRRTGRLDEAIEAGQRLVDLLETEGDTYVLGNSLVSLIVLADNYPERTTALHGGDVLGFVQSARSRIDVSENMWASVAAQCVEASLLGDGEVGQAALRACFVRADALEAELSDRILPRLQLAYKSDDAQAQILLDEADALTLLSDDPTHRGYVHGARRRVAERQGDLDTVSEQGRLALDAFESAATLGATDRDTAGMLSWWAQGHYHELAAALRSERTAEAFEVVERYRGQILLRRLLDQGTFRATDEDRRQLRVLEQHFETARERLSEATDDDGRRAVISELAALRDRTGRLQGAIRDRSDRSGLLHVPPVALAEVQQELSEREAIISYQLAPELWSRDLWGESWAWVITRTSVHQVPIPHRADLRESIALFGGLFARRDDSVSVPAVGLYGQLLAEALESLPESVDQLTLVPDGPLHALPFGALRARADGPPLDATLSLATTPSLSLWHHWRTRSVPEWRRTAVVLGDPAFTPVEGLARLPGAAVEAQRVLEHVGNASLALDAAAGEKWLDALVDETTGIVHIAAHAVVNDVYPDRSAILLAPQQDTDGRLLASEIATLQLDGPLVVLSACRGAAGPVVGGEGPMGLSRAFFQGGARAVIASLWPLRDDDALALFDGFYTGIAEGLDVGQALQRAKAERVAQGAPAEAWAGVTLYGDATYVPLPGGRPSTQTSAPLGVLAAGTVGLLGVLAGLLWWRRKRT